MFNDKTVSCFRHLCMVCADTIMYIILSAWESLRLMLQCWTHAKKLVLMQTAVTFRKLLQFSLCSLPFYFSAFPPPLPHFSWNYLNERLAFEGERT